MTPNEVYKIELNKTIDIVVIQNDYILPYKYYKVENDNYSYNNDLIIDKDILSDNNVKSFLEINSEKQNQLVLNFDEKLEKDTFDFVFNYQSDNYTAKFFIASERGKFSEIQKQNISDFSFDYLKIVFVSRSKDELLENIKIEELYFSKR
jgi:hypothetical protein